MPEPLAWGELQGYRYGVEAALRGTPGARVCGNIDALVEGAAGMLAHLHRRTRSAHVEAARRLWQDRLQRLARLPSMRERVGFERMHDHFLARLEHVPFTVTAHNDYHLGNVLFAESGSVSGILDWDSSDLAGLPGTDLVHLIVSSYRRRVGAPLGQTIGRWLNGGGAVEQRIFDDYCSIVQLPVDLSWCVTMYVGVELWRLTIQQSYGLHFPRALRRSDSVIDELVMVGDQLAARAR